MKRLLVVLLLLLSAAALAQVSPPITVLNRNGQPVAGASVAACSASETVYPCVSIVQTYTDASFGTPCTLSPTIPGPTSGTGCTNPGITDYNGNASIFIATPNVYYAQIYGGYLTPYVLPFTLAGSLGSLSSPPPIGDVVPNTGNFTTLTSKVSNGVAYVAKYAGSDLGAKITACFAASQSVCVVDVNAGQASTTAFTIPADSVLRLIPQQTATANPTVFTFSQPITMLHDAVIEGPPCATAQCAVQLKEADGANLAYLIHMTGDRATLQSINLEGNYANNSTAQDGVFVDAANRVAFHNVQINHFKRYGVYVPYASTVCCGRIDDSSLFNQNYNSNLYCAAPSDWFFDNVEFEGSVTGWGAEFHGCAAARLTNVDFGANGGGGWKIVGTVAHAATQMQIAIAQFQGNNGYDIYADGSVAAYSCGYNNFVGLNFFGLAAGAPNNTYDAMYLHDCGYSEVVGNHFGANSHTYRYGYHSDSTNGTPLPSTVSGNVFEGAKGTGQYSLLTNGSGAIIDFFGVNYNANGVALTVPNNNGVYFSDSTGGLGSLFIQSGNNFVFSGTDGTGAAQPILSNAFHSTGSALYLYTALASGTAANPASSGFLRLTKTDCMDWRNNANGANLGLCIDASDNLSFNGHAFLSSAGDLTGGVVNATTIVAATSVKVGGTYYVPVVEASSAGHASCIKAVGPPVQIGYCSTVVDASGNCTCN